MTRIIAGSARGRRLTTPRTDSTRPTADRVREAVFSTLTSRLGTLSGVRFLDLYAGSGAVGLEAWSRGATHVLCVESARPAVESIRHNIVLLGAGHAVVVSAAKCATRVASGPGTEGFDVAYVDPPYDQSAADVTVVLELLLAHGWLNPGAVVAVERSGRSPRFTWPEGYEPDVVKSYGETTVSFAQAGGLTVGHNGPDPEGG